MALRLIEVFLPVEQGAQLQESLSKNGVVAHWTEQLSEQQILVRVLLQVENTEPFLDGLEKRLSGADFRAVMVPVEATVPRLEAKKEEQARPGQRRSRKKVAPSERISRAELYQQVTEGAQLTRIFVVLVALSAVVAAVGIDYNNITVVIGAMVIAPLLGPNVALALATALGDTGAREVCRENQHRRHYGGAGSRDTDWLSHRGGSPGRRNPEPASYAAKGCCSCACFRSGRRAFDHHRGVGCPDWRHGCGSPAPSAGDLRAAGRLSRLRPGRARDATVCHERDLREPRRRGDPSGAERKTENVVGGGPGQESN